MSEKNISWFHCGRCGTLFQSLAGNVDDRLCTSCGCNPSLGIETEAEDLKKSKETVTPLPYLTQEPFTPEREKLSRRKRKPSYVVAKIVAGWMIFIFGVLFAAKHFWPDDDSTEKQTLQTDAPAHLHDLEDDALMDDARPLWNASFFGFLSASTPEQRNQFVLAPIATASKMARFDSMNPAVSLDPSSIQVTGGSVIRFPDGKRAIETQWTGVDKRRMDAVFFEENGEWHLDWEHFVRYSDLPWSLFLTGSGGDHGEFRVLARQRLADERKGSDTISMVLYSPRFGYSDQAGSASPEFLIKKDSKEGKLLEAAFQMRKDGKRPFDAKLASIDPEGMIRLKLKINRITNDQNRSFEIEEITACHWYSTDATGIPPAAQAPEN